MARTVGARGEIGWRLKCSEVRVEHALQGSTLLNVKPIYLMEKSKRKDRFHSDSTGKLSLTSSPADKRQKADVIGSYAEGDEVSEALKVGQAIPMQAR